MLFTSLHFTLLGLFCVFFVQWSIFLQLVLFEVLRATLFPLNVSLNNSYRYFRMRDIVQISISFNGSYKADQMQVRFYLYVSNQGMHKNSKPRLPRVFLTRKTYRPMNRHVSKIMGSVIFGRKK